MEITKEVILKAWKSEEYRESLPESAREEIPARPTAVDGGELGDAELEQAAGGATPFTPLLALPVAAKVSIGGAAGGAGVAGFVAGMESD